MNKITQIKKMEDYQKRFVVRCNAFLTNPELTQGYFMEIYGKGIDIELILRMNPATPNICILEDELIEYWDGIRKLAVQSLRSVPIADHLVRLQVFSEMYEILRKQGNYELMIELLQAVLAETEAVYTAHAESLHQQSTGFKFPAAYEA